MSKNLQFHKLTLQNFMSYGKKKTEVLLDAGGTTLIKGVNLDDTVNGIGANGVGKSTIINAVVYAFYGESIGDSKVDELINDINKTKCIVTIEFSVGSDKYVIERYRKMKSGPEGNYTNIYKNDDIDKDPSDPTRVNLAKATIPETNKFTKDLVGMPKDLFVRLVVFDADEQSFFKLPAGAQREVMENLFQITILSEKAEFFREDQRNVKKAIELQETTIKFDEKKLEEHEERLAAAQRRVTKWDIGHKSELEDLQYDLDQLLLIDVDAERDMFEHNDQLDDQISEIDKRKSKIILDISELNIEITTISNDRDKITSKISSIKRDKKRKDDLIDALNKKLESFDDHVCPECSQSMPHAHEKSLDTTKQITVLATENEELFLLIEVQEALLPPLDAKLEELESKLKGLKAVRQELTQEIIAINERYQKPSVKTIEQLGKIESKITMTQSKIKDLEKSVNPHIDAFEELESQSVEEVDYTQLNELKKLLDHQQFMLKLLTDKKSFLRQRLINKRLPFLNERLTHYLTQLGLPYQVEFLSDLTANIKRRGKSKSFSTLSHGQKARVNFALSFAFRDVMERVNRKVNMCLLDEVLDKALCDVGANAAITMISEKAKRDKLSIFVITHKKEIANRFHNIMTVTMKNGFSEIDVS